MIEVNDTDRIDSLLSTESMYCFDALDVLEITNKNEETKEFKELLKVELVNTSTEKKR